MLQFLIRHDLLYLFEPGRNRVHTWSILIGVFICFVISSPKPSKGWLHLQLCCIICLVVCNLVALCFASYLLLLGSLFKNSTNIIHCLLCCMISSWDTQPTVSFKLIVVTWFLGISSWVEPIKVAYCLHLNRCLNIMSFLGTSNLLSLSSWYNVTWFSCSFVLTACHTLVLRHM